MNDSIITSIILTVYWQQHFVNQGLYQTIVFRVKPSFLAHLPTPFARQWALQQPQPTMLQDKYLIYCHRRVRYIKKLYQTFAMFHRCFVSPLLPSVEMMVRYADLKTHDEFEAWRGRFQKSCFGQLRLPLVFLLKSDGNRIWAPIPTMDWSLKGAKK